MTVDAPLSHELELNADVDSTITTVTVFPNHADVTRTFSCQLDCGHTRVKISSGFPSSFQESGLRIDITEGVTLEDVKIVWDKLDTDSKYEKIDALYEKKSLLQKSLARCKRMVTTLENYSQVALDKKSGLGPCEVGHFLDIYEATGTKWDTKVARLEKEIRELEDKIDEEEFADESSVPSEGPKYSRAGITFAVSTETPKSVVLKVTYGVTDAHWNAGYDLFASLKDDRTVTLVYKALISNNTGESWKDVELKLESVAPQVVSRLQPWKLSFRKTQNDDPNTFSSYPPPKVLARVNRVLSSQLTLPAKTPYQYFTLGRYTMEAQLSRLCTPRISGGVSLKAKVTNTCNYPLRTGNSGVYLDGNFVSNVYLSSVNPGEKFDVFIGTDPDIQIVYHPCVKDATAIESPSPFAFKPVSAYSCRQRITVWNARDNPISSLTIIDNIPMAEDIDIVVKLVNPPLKYPEPISTGFQDGSQARAGIQVTEGIPQTCSVLARWDMVDEPPQDLSLLGANGKINWVCSMGGNESMDLNLLWQVLVYSSKQIKDF